MSFKSNNLSMSFDSRSTYATYVTQWKHFYAELSEQLRATKSVRRDVNKEFSANPSSSNYQKLANAQHKVIQLKEKANSFLEERKLSKEAAASQYLQHK